MNFYIDEYLDEKKVAGLDDLLLELPDDPPDLKSPYNDQEETKGE